MDACVRALTHAHTHTQRHTKTHTCRWALYARMYTSSHACLCSDPLWFIFLFVMKIEGRTGHGGEKTTLILCVCVCVCECVSVWVCVSVCVSLPHEYSLSNLSSVFRHLGRQQTIILCHYGRCYHSASLQPQQPQTGIYSQWNRHESSSLWLSGRRAGRQTMPPRWEAPFNNVSCNIAKWGWTLKSRLSVVDADYVEITFLRRARENVTKAQIGQTVSICLLH